MRYVHVLTCHSHLLGRLWNPSQNCKALRGLDQDRFYVWWKVLVITLLSVNMESHIYK